MPNPVANFIEWSYSDVIAGKPAVAGAAIVPTKPSTSAE